MVVGCELKELGELDASAGAEEVDGVWIAEELAVAVGGELEELESKAKLDDSDDGSASEDDEGALETATEEGEAETWGDEEKDEGALCADVEGTGGGVGIEDEGTGGEGKLEGASSTLEEGTLAGEESEGGGREDVDKDVEVTDTERDVIDKDEVELTDVVEFRLTLEEPVTSSCRASGPACLQNCTAPFFSPRKVTRRSIRVTIPWKCGRTRDWGRGSDSRGHQEKQCR